MSENKKQGNAQIPREAIKGAADKNAKLKVTSISSEQIKLEGEWEKYKTEVTNQHIRETIKSTDLEQGSSIKAYDNKEKPSKKEIGRD